MSITEQNEQTRAEWIAGIARTMEADVLRYSSGYGAAKSIIATLKACGHTPKYCGSGDPYCPICECLAAVYSEQPELF